MTIKNVKEKKWIVKEHNDEASKSGIAKIVRTLNIHPIVARLLYNRGYTDIGAVKNFIGMESEMLSNPFDMKDIDKAIERIHSSIVNHEKITVYGDYDVDGVTSVCTLYLYLKSKGADIDYYIPNRVGDGYGVSDAAIKQIADGGGKLIITVDTGITANEEVQYAKSIGVDFVITDHHECHADLPAAAAVVNPHRPDCNYPFKELAGVGVVFKLISAYEERICKKSRREAALNVFSEYADLVAIGTIADVMPIKNENRIIVSYGLKMIETTERPGLIALMEASTPQRESSKNDRRAKRSKVTSGYVGYTLAPRINAAGRIKSAEIAVKLFLARNLDSAKRIAEDLCQANKERQAEENNIILEAYEKIEKLDLDNTHVIVLDADNWHHGVIGIVSSRITEKFSKPSILVSFEGNDSGTSSPDDVGKGSGRSVKGLNLVDALCYCEDHLVKFGGHELAAGLSVTRGELNNFREKINEYARLNLANIDMTPTLEADCVISLDEVNINLAQQLQKLEPYGVGNPIPAFIIKNVWVNEIVGVSDGRHTRLVLSDGNSTVTAMFFSTSPESTDIHNGDKVDVLFNIDVNEWLGRKSVQLIVKDIRSTETAGEASNKAKDRFREIWNGATFSSEENVLPVRDDFVSVYNLILNSARVGISSFTHKELESRLASSYDGAKIGYIKLKIIIRVFQELNILGIDEFEEEHYHFTIRYNQKTNLEKSFLLKKLKNQQKEYNRT